MGDVAVCWNYLEITATPAGQESLRRSGNVLSVFRRGSDNQWRIWRDANLLGLSSWQSINLNDEGCPNGGIA